MTTLTNGASAPGSGGAHRVHGPGDVFLDEAARPPRLRVDAGIRDCLGATGEDQGLYNGFLAAGLIWGCFGGGRGLIVFLLVCVVGAGVYGAATVKRSILFVQALPAATALLFLWLWRL